MGTTRKKEFLLTGLIPWFKLPIASRCVEKKEVIYAHGDETKPRAPRCSWLFSECSVLFVPTPWCLQTALRVNTLHPVTNRGHFFISGH